MGKVTHRPIDGSHSTRHWRPLRRALWTLLIGIVALWAMLFEAAHVEAGTISFFDGTFNNADWNNTEILNPGGNATFRRPTKDLVKHRYALVI